MHFRIIGLLCYPLLWLYELNENILRSMHRFHQTANRGNDTNKKITDSCAHLLLAMMRDERLH